MHSENTDKLTEKSFLISIGTSIIGILICLVSLCSVTWAWFTGDVTSPNNEIKTAPQCLLQVTVSDDNAAFLGTISADNTASSTNGEVVFPNLKLSLKPNVIYQVSVILPKDSGSGYCKIDANGESYYTDTLYTHENDTPSTITFQLTVTTDTDVTFTPRWGIYSGTADIVKEETLKIP